MRMLKTAIMLSCLSSFALATDASPHDRRHATKSTDVGDPSTVMNVSNGGPTAGGSGLSPRASIGLCSDDTLNGGAMTAPAIDIDDHIANDSAAGAGHIAPH